MLTVYGMFNSSEFYNAKIEIFSRKQNIFPIILPDNLPYRSICFHNSRFPPDMVITFNSYSLFGKIFLNCDFGK